jgi:MoaA/NifB/PqqE/SkfB family radical SAM enzyme
LSKAGTLAISFTGGEPLLREDIGRIIGYAASKGITSKINTNGLLIAKKIDQLAKVEQVNLSFDGPEDIHDQIRGVGSYRALFDAVSLLHKNKRKIVFHVVLSKYNVPAIDFILNKCREVNVGAFFQPATELYLLKKDINPHSLEKDDFYKAIVSLIQKKKLKDKHILNSVSGLRHLASWPYPKRIFCAAGKVMFRINPRGEIYNCERFPDASGTSCLKDGVKKVMRVRGFKGCKECWCGPLVELNLLMQGKIDAIINSLSYI